MKSLRKLNSIKLMDMTGTSSLFPEAIDEEYDQVECKKLK
jgi:hypothetical protein